MPKKKILVVFGTRPEAIKMGPLVNELKSRSAFSTFVCVSGQHREMLDQVLDVFHIQPDYDFNIMKKQQSLFDITQGILKQMEHILCDVRPDVVLVHGDTTTAFVASLACFYRQIPVGHVEAGLRTHNIYSPFPEEFNREAVGLIATYHFAPTSAARDNLLHEGKNSKSIYVTGNTVIDALRTTVSKQFTHPELEWAKDSRLLLITAHRRENLGEPMEHMFRAIRRIIEDYPDVKALYPIHLNPTVRTIAQQCLSGCDRIHLIEPVDFVTFHNMMENSYFVLTDSGGIQEEAPSLNKPVLVMRNTTERPEGVVAGALKLVGTEEASIYAACRELLDNPGEYRRMSDAVNPYGDGLASRRIADILEKSLC